MSLPSHMTKLGSLKPSDPVVTSVPTADWAESDSDSPSFIRNKPEGAMLSAALSFGQKTYDGSAAQTLTAADLGALTSHQDISGKADRATTYTKTETDSAISAAIATVTDSAPTAFDTLREIADWIGDSGSGAQAVINQVAGKADKSEMSVTSGTGADADKTTIQLKSGTSATVLTAHQSLVGYATTTGMNAALALKADAASLPYSLVTVVPTAGAPFVLASCFPITGTAGTELGPTFTVQESDTNYRIVSRQSEYRFIINVDGDDYILFIANADGTFAQFGEDIDTVAFGGFTPEENETPVLGFTPTAQLTDRAVNLVSPTVTALPPVWEWSDGLDHGQPVYGKIYDDGEYQEYGWGFSGEGETPSDTDSLGNHYDFLLDDQDATELSFYDYNTDDTIVASRVTQYETDVSSLALPHAVADRSRDFMVRLAMPENAAMFSWPSGVEYETEDGQMPDVSEPGVYLLAFTETGTGRFALLCRKVQGVE